MKILVTGGTVFVSRFIAEYFAKGNDVYVLNRGTREQPQNVTTIIADRNNLGNSLKDYSFDLVIDTGYNAHDVKCIKEALSGIKQYVFISSSAVYLETNAQPFSEEQRTGYNKQWQEYGTNKIDAEDYIVKNIPQAYILRPPYLYGKLENLYRAPFVFDCAMKNRAFYICGDGKMNLQFFNVHDLCRFIDIILDKQPQKHIFNVGNNEIVTVEQWVKMCYEVAGKEAEIKYVPSEIEARQYFCFRNYSYVLNVSKQNELMPETVALKQGINEEYEWYLSNSECVQKRDYMKYIDENLKTY